MTKKINLNNLDLVDANILVTKYREEYDKEKYNVFVLTEQIKNYQLIIEKISKENPELFEKKTQYDEALNKLYEDYPEILKDKKYSHEKGDKDDKTTAIDA